MKRPTVILFAVGSLALLIFSIAYVPGRVVSLLPLFQPKSIRVVFRVLYSVFMLFSIFGMPITAVTANPRIGGYAIAVGLVFAFHTYFTLALMMIDLVAWNCVIFARLEFPPIFHSSVVVASFFLGLVSTIIGGWKGSRLTVNRVVVSLIGVSAEVNIVHITDIHLGHTRGREYLDQIVQQTNALSPDFVVITGDLVESDVVLDPERDCLSPLANLESPTYFTTGNHELFVDCGRLFRLLSSFGVRILMNEAHYISIRSQGLLLAGLEYMNADERSVRVHVISNRTVKNTLPLVLARARSQADFPVVDQDDGDVPVVLLQHSPEGAQYAADCGVDLMLCGHTHGGQMFPATLFASLLFGFGKGLFRVKPSTGLPNEEEQHNVKNEEKKEMQLFVSQGAGTFGPRIRLGSSNEIALIQIVPHPGESGLQ